MNPVWTRVLFKERKVWSNLSLSELNNINYGFEISDNLFAGVGGGGREKSSRHWPEKPKLVLNNCRDVIKKFYMKGNGDGGEWSASDLLKGISSWVFNLTKLHKLTSYTCTQGRPFIMENCSSMYNDWLNLTTSYVQTQCTNANTDILGKWVEKGQIL